jgi:hypothetical protein
MKNVDPPNPNEPTKPTFETALAAMVAAIEADPEAPPKTECEKADALREALLRYIEKNCPSPL